MFLLVSRSLKLAWFPLGVERKMRLLGDSVKQLKPALHTFEVLAQDALGVPLVPDQETIEAVAAENRSSRPTGGQQRLTVDPRRGYGASIRLTFE
jgi:hypothetical protein